MVPSATSVRFAAVGDIHVTKDSAGTLRGFFARAGEAADVLLLCGDLTDYGTAEEAKVLADELAVVKIPIVAVLGNHDFESGTPEAVCETLTRAGVRVLDGEAVEIEGVGIAGAKGFAGGFGRGSLGAWGEPVIKQFVREAHERDAHGVPRLAATITAHHLLHNRNAMFKGGMRPHYYCLPVLKRETHLPVLIDPSHAGGKAWMVPALSRAAIAAGADGLLVEMHPNPPAAWSDADQALNPEELTTLMGELRGIARVLGRDL